MPAMQRAARGDAWRELVLLLAVRDDVCPACKYDLRGQMHGPCPECGRLRQMPGLVSATVPTN
jgi:hypothetical protein